MIVLGVSVSTINSRRWWPLRSFLLVILRAWTILFTFCVDVVIPSKGSSSSASSSMSNDRLCGCMLEMLGADAGAGLSEVLVTVRIGKLWSPICPSNEEIRSCLSIFRSIGLSWIAIVDKSCPFSQQNSLAPCVWNNIFIYDNLFYTKSKLIASEFLSATFFTLVARN